jgi:DNA invertase Pin-like site-specific DNA recombinase
MDFFGLIGAGAVSISLGAVEGPRRIGRLVPPGRCRACLWGRNQRGRRGVADAASVIADFDKKGIELVAIAEGFDMTNPYGRAMAQMASVFAELERAMIRERTRSAMSVKRSRGERISGHAPFGWDFGPDGHLVENAREQQIIARVRRLRAEGLSYRGIANRLDEEGILPKRGRRWIHTTVKGILARNAA